MKLSTRTGLLVVLLLLIVTGSKAQTDGDQLFDASVLHEIRFVSADETFFDKLVDIWGNSPLGDTPYLLGKVIIDGQTVDSVGVRVKGGLSAFNEKKPLKIDFNYYKDGQTYDGLAKINLQNGDFDAPLQRDVLSYHIFRNAGVKASRTAYAKVFFNNTYHGVYILVEQVDKVFLKNQFANEDGVLYKNKLCQIEVASGDSTLEYFNEMYQISITLSGDAFQQAIEPILDTDAFLRYFLVQHFINATDNTIDVGCNYYIYRIPNAQKMYWIPWDFNYALYGGVNYPLLYEGQNALFKKMLAIPKYRQRYLELTCEMMDYLFVEADLQHLIDQNSQLIRAAVEIDPRYDFTMDQFDNGAEFLKTLIAQRRQDFLDDLTALSLDCVPLEPSVASGIVINEFVASNDIAGGVPDPQGQYPDWIELFNNAADTISLHNTYLSNDRDFLKHWRFPDETVIAPGGYLIIWADRDITDPGLHTDFKLDKNGGEIYLTFEDLTKLDAVVYGPQTTNIAFARVPNGVGPFVQQNATFGANNAPVSIQNQAFVPSTLLVFPNPALEVLRVKLTEKLPETPIKIQFENALGQTLIQLETTDADITLDLKNFASGIYFIIFEIDNQSISKKVFLSR